MHYTLTILVLKAYLYENKIHRYSQVYRNKVKTFGIRFQMGNFPHQESIIFFLPNL